jgi:membrane associated rhomboid family serine protease
VIVAIAVIVVAWLVSVARGVDPWAPTPEALLHAGGSGAEGGRAWWRLLTAWTVHAGAVHVGFNVCLLMLVGPALERRVGHAITALTFVGGAVTAAAVSRWWSPYVLTVGASGAAFALAGGLIVRLVREHGTRRRWTIVALVAFLVVNTIAALVTATVDHVAHVAGLVAGAAIGAVIELRRAGPAIAVAVVVAVSAGAIALGPRPRQVAATLEAIDRLEVRYRELLASHVATDAALADAIRREVVEPLGALAGQLGDDTAMPGRLRGRLAAARRYLDARRLGLRLYVEYLETGRTELRDQIVEADHAARAALELLER